MAGYRDDREQYYLIMMKEISEHKDFGRRNPVDIGLECGYTEEDVLDMIHMLQQDSIVGKSGYWRKEKAVDGRDYTKPYYLRLWNSHSYGNGNAGMGRR